MAQRRGRRVGCGGCGCLLLLVLAAVLLWVALVPLRLLERIGLRESAAARMLSGPPDWEAAEELMGVLAQSGMTTRGLQLYVMPLTGTDETAAIAVLDASRGFGTGEHASQDALLRTMDRLAASDAVDRLGITRVAVSYRDTDGKELIVLTGTTEDVRAFAAGALSQKEYLDRLHADVDLRWLTEQVQKARE